MIIEITKSIINDIHKDNTIPIAETARVEVDNINAVKKAKLSNFSSYQNKYIPKFVYKDLDGNQESLFISIENSKLSSRRLIFFRLSMRNKDPLNLEHCSCADFKFKKFIPMSQKSFKQTIEMLDFLKNNKSRIFELQRKFIGSDSFSFIYGLRELYLSLKKYAYLADELKEFENTNNIKELFEFKQKLIDICENVNIDDKNRDLIIKNNPFKIILIKNYYTQRITRVILHFSVFRQTIPDDSTMAPYLEKAFIIYNLINKLNRTNKLISLAQKASLKSLSEKIN